MASPAVQDALPLELTSFLGRKDDLNRLSDALVNERLVTIAGTGGIGKTRTAVRVARMTAPHWRDGIVFVELAPLATGAGLEVAIHQALGGSQRSDDPREALVERIGEQQLAIILDNCEHIVERVAAAVEALLRGCPNLHILATSRRTLGITGEFVWRLPPLPLPPSTGDVTGDALAASPASALFLDRARRARPGFELTAADVNAVAQVCRALDGVPLAIELAAARVRMFSILQLADRIHEQLPLLTGGSRAGPARQQTMRATIAWSHDQLDQRERLLFRRLAVFSGGWSLEAAEGVCSGNGINPDEVLDLLDLLVDCSLVTADADGAEARFRFLSPILEFARAELLASGEAEAVGAGHCRWMAAFASRAEPHLAGPAEEFWCDRLEQDFDNLLAALAWAESHHGDLEVGLRLVGSLRLFWVRSGRFVQASMWSRRLLSAAGRTFPNARTVALVTAAQSGYFIDPVEAKPYALEGVSLAREVGDPVALARALSVYCHACFSAGDPEAAKSAAQEGLGLLEGRPGHSALVAELLLDLGSAEIESGLAAAGEASLKQALGLARTAGSHRLENRALTNLGEVARLRGDYGEAATHYRAALAAGGYVAGFGIAMLNLGFTQLLTHDRAAARDSLSSCLRQGVRLQQRAMVVFGLMGMAALEAISGDAARAARWLGASEKGLDGVVIQSTDRPVLELAREVAEKKLGPRFAVEMEVGRRIDLMEAAREALASSSPTRETAPARAPFALSARETEVLRLLADGATNREIADLLVLSTRTVETHLANLYAKLGARSRVEALRLAVTAGLLTLSAQKPSALGS